MALYLLSMKHVSHGQGRSSVAAAAYRSSERLKYNGQIHDFSDRHDVVYKEIFLPDHAPPEYSDRPTLWSEAEKAEDSSTRWKTARTAHEVLIALPRELTLQTSIALARDFVADCLVAKGMCADLAIHRGDSKEKNSIEADHADIPLHNPHGHILLTTRPVGPDGFSKRKNRDWEKREFLIELREQWADYQNRLFMRKGLEARVSHRSYKDRGIDRQPKKHLGPVLSAMERRGVETYWGNKNRAIDARNQQLLEQERSQQQEQEYDHDMESGLSR